MQWVLSCFVTSCNCLSFFFAWRQTQSRTESKVKMPVRTKRRVVKPKSDALKAGILRPLGNPETLKKWITCYFEKWTCPNADYYEKMGRVSQHILKNGIVRLPTILKTNVYFFQNNFKNDPVRFPAILKNGVFFLNSLKKDLSISNYFEKWYVFFKIVWKMTGYFRLFGKTVCFFKIVWKRHHPRRPARRPGHNRK